jgi:hypothetical protein
VSRKGSFGASDYKPIPPVSVDLKPKKSSKHMPPGLFFQGDLPFNIVSTSLRLMYNELRDINVADFPNATHDLLRSFLECTLVFYLKETDQFSHVEKHEKHNPKLGEMLAYVASEECKSIDDENLKATVRQVKSDWDSPYSLERMNMTTHNENWTSSERDVRIAWGKIEKLFKIMLSPSSV